MTLLFFKNTAPRTLNCTWPLGSQLKANDHLDAAKLICLHLSLASTSADVLLEFQSGVNKCNHRSIWGQGGEETAEEAINPCLDQASFPTMSYEDKGIWKSASPAKAEDTPRVLHRMSVLLLSTAPDRTQKACQCCLSRWRRQCQVQWLILHNLRPSGHHVDSEWGCLISGCQSGGQQQGPHMVPPVKSSNFYVTGTEALTVTRDEEERIIFAALTIKLFIFWLNISSQRKLKPSP